MAEERNLNVELQRQDIRDQAEVVKQRVSALLPSLDGSLRYNRGEQGMTGANAGFGANSDISTIRYENSFVGLQANWTLFNIRQFADWKVAEFNKEIAELRYTENLQRILELTAQGYFTHLRNLARLEVIDANIARDEVLLKLATDQVEAGVATPIDRTRAEVQLANNRIARLQQETVVLQSEMQLKVLLDLELDAPLMLATAPVVDPTPPQPMATAVREILDNRPEYITALRELERNQFARKTAGLDRLPRVNAFAEWGYQSEAPFDGMQEEVWTVGATLSVPIIAGYEIDALQTRAGIAVRSQEIILRTIEQDVGSQYLVTRQNLSSRFQQIAIARQTVDLSQEELELARTRFTEGVADNSDVVLAQANLAAAEDQVVEAVYLYQLARVDFARLRGNVRLLLDE